MEAINAFAQLREAGKIMWAAHERGWMARPDEIVNALSNEGFEEYKREVTRSRRDREPTGGIWQGLNIRTGAVASAIWVHQDESGPAIVFIDIDGKPLTDA